MAYYVNTLDADGAATIIGPFPTERQAELYGERHIGAMDVWTVSATGEPNLVTPTPEQLKALAEAEREED